MPNVQQIKTSIRGYNLLPGQPQLLAAIGKVLKLDDFWAHSFSLILRLRVNRGWPLTDLRDGLPRMAKRKTKRNAGRLEARRGFKIRKDPMVRLAGGGPRPDVPDCMGLTRVCGQPFLFAIARDAHTIFASWNIDWPSLFEKVLPVDRQVHLRLYGADGLQEKSVAVEPMAMMHYLTTSGLHTSYRLEVGYYQPADAWHSAATSQEIVMPPSAIGKAADVDLATIPFHVAFQQLVNLFESDSKISLAVAISRFEKDMLRSEQSNPLTAADKELLRDLGISLPQIAAAWRRFDETDAEKLVKLTREQPALEATSRSREFGESSWS